jgi:hypothetical protein
LKRGKQKKTKQKYENVVALGRTSQKNK